MHNEDCSGVMPVSIEHSRATTMARGSRPFSAHVETRFCSIWIIPARRARLYAQQPAANALAWLKRHVRPNFNFAIGPPMIDIIAVSTHDAKKLVGELVRLLEAETYPVRVISGRHPASEIEAAKTSRDAILMVWSKDAPSSSYMLDWLRHSDPSRRIEIFTAPGWPERAPRKAPVIDFSNWRGERGGRAWNALNERLRVVAHVVNPPKQPAVHAAAALGVASLAAVAVAIGVRSDETPFAPALEPQQSAQQLDAPVVSVGGAVYAIEPASLDDLALVPDVRPLRMPLVEVTQAPQLAELSTAPLPEVRDPTLIERLREFNPLAAVNSRDTEPNRP
jgi:hypothetical protein